MGRARLPAKGKNKGRSLVKSKSDRHSLSNVLEESLTNVDLIDWAMQPYSVLERLLEAILSTRSSKYCVRRYEAGVLVMASCLSASRESMEIGVFEHLALIVQMKMITYATKQMRKLTVHPRFCHTCDATYLAGGCRARTSVGLNPIGAVGLGGRPVYLFVVH